MVAASVVSSVQSGQSAGSAAPDKNAGPNLGGGADELNQNQSVQTYIFGLLYVVTKHKPDRVWQYGVFKLCIEFLQLFVVFMNINYGWTIDRQLWVWRVVSSEVARDWIVSQGYAFYVGVLLVFAGITIGCIVIGMWLHSGFKTARYDTAWPLQLFRFIVSVVFVDFEILGVAYYLSAWNCRFIGTSSPGLRNHLILFPTKECLAMPHLGYGAVALAVCIIYILFGAALTLANCETNLASRRLLAAATTWPEVYNHLVRAAMVFITVFFINSRRTQAVLLSLCALFMVWSFLRWPPHLNQYVNHMRCGMYATIFWVSCMLCAMLFGRKLREQTYSWRDDLTDYMLWGMGPAFAVGMLLSMVRIYYGTVTVIKAFKAMPSNAKPKDIYRFTDPRQVELVVRVARRWLDPDTLDPEAIKAAEVVLKAGSSIFHNHAWITLINAGFIMDMQNRYQAGYSQVQAAKKCDPGWLEIFLVYVREQEHMFKSLTHKSGETTLDLVSYVEFQRTLRVVLLAHKAALYSTRNYWKLLLQHNMTFTKLARALKHRDDYITKTEKAYRSAMERYPANVKLIRLYARFLLELKNDPWGADKNFNEAEKLENQADNNTQALDDPAGEGAQNMLSSVDEKNTVVVIINAAGIIQMASKMALALFGYKKGELEGKNVSVLCPPPFNQRHDGYLRRYLTTGVPHILDRVVDVLALHKDRYVVPTRLAVTKISGTGEDSVFMGIFRASEPDNSVVKVICMPSGLIASVERRFNDWFGINSQDLVGKHVGALVQEHESMAKVLDAANNASEDELRDGAVTVQGVHVMHKFFDPVETDIIVRMGGSAGQRMFIFCLQRTKDSEFLMVTDAKGRLTYMTSSLGQLLGYEDTIAAKHSLATLLPPPFSFAHSQWLKDHEGRPSVYSCRSTSALTVCLAANNKVQVAVRPSITLREEGGQATFLVKLARSSFEEGLNERRLQLEVNEKGVVTSVGNSASSLFGFAPTQLLNRSLSNFIAAFRSANPAQQQEHIEHLMEALIQRAADPEIPQTSLRVGVHPPRDDSELFFMDAKAAGFLTRQTKPAILQVEVQEHEDFTTSIFLNLWRADLLTGVLEVDRKGLITKLYDNPLYPTPLIFGVGQPAMNRAKLRKFVDLEGEPVAKLLKAGGASKSALRKSGNDGGIKVGPIKKLDGIHSDGEPMSLTVQAVQASEGGHERYTLIIHVVNPSKGSANFARFLLAEEVEDGDETASLGAKSEHIAASVVNEPVQRRAVFTEERERPPGPRGIKIVEPSNQERESSSKGRARFSESVRDAPGLQLEAAASDDSKDLNDEQRDNALEEQTHQELDKEVERLSDELNPAKKTALVDRTMSWMASFNHREAADYAARSEAGVDVGAMEDVRTDNGSEFLGQNSGRFRVVEQQPAGYSGGTVAPSAAMLGPGGALNAPASGAPNAAMDDGSQADSYSQLDSASQAGDEDKALDYDNAVDYKQGKRYRKLLKHLTQNAVLRVAHIFQWRTGFCLFAMLLCHMVCFFILYFLLTSQEQNIQDLDSAGQAVSHIHEIAIYARTLDLLYRGVEAPGLYVKNETDHFAFALLEACDDFEKFHQGVFLGFHNLRRLPSAYNLSEIWQQKVINETNIYDTDPGYLVYEETSLWKMGNRYLQAARDVYQNHILWGTTGNISDHRQFQYIVLNGPWSLFNGYTATLDGLVEEAVSHTDAVNKVQLVMLVVDGVLVAVVAACYVWHLAQQVNMQRYRLFALFFLVPLGFLRALCSKPVVLEDDSDDDDLSDVGGMQDTAALNAPPNTKETDSDTEGPKMVIAMRPDSVSKKKRSPFYTWQGLKQRVSSLFALDSGLDGGKRTLRRDMIDVWWLILPFPVWIAMLVTVYILGYLQLANIADPVSTLNVGRFVQMRVIRTVYFANELCITSPGAEMQQAANILRVRADLLAEEYDIWAYGADKLTVNPHFHSAKTGLTFSSPVNADKLFRTSECLRYNESTCFTPNNTYYQVSRSGLDAVVQRLIEEAYLLAADNQSDIQVLSPRLDYCWQVGMFDGYNGFDKTNQLFLDEVLKVYATVAMAQIVVLALTWVWAILYMLLAVRPQARRITREFKQVAAMMCQLPDNLDVEGLVKRAVLQGMGEDEPKKDKKGDKSGMQSGNSSMASGSEVDAEPPPGKFGKLGMDADGLRQRKVGEGPASGKVFPVVDQKDYGRLQV